MAVAVLSQPAPWQRERQPLLSSVYGRSCDASEVLDGLHREPTAKEEEDLASHQFQIIIDIHNTNQCFVLFVRQQS
ncbi:hypothetical protein CSUB01_12470 [Colletotrichum sublineola]|uniref:Uncharacterized protein n=1 Tax=Colletotrichum sublineola TaxID=1173701 RepID=A0A066X188_COLSU|nr:hypothetical protein CSUB01_12470 [Colletotrichum sublineola]